MSLNIKSQTFGIWLSATSFDFRIWRFCQWETDRSVLFDEAASC